MIIKIYSWNLNGIRALYNKFDIKFFDWIKGDILCFQEIKAHKEQLPEKLINVDGYQSYWFSAQRKGYSGVSLYTKIEPLKILYGFNNEKFDIEGRVIFAEYENFLLVNSYFPNGGRGAERVVYKLEYYDELFYFLEKNYRDKKGIIVAGDFNTAHKEIDLAKPKENENVSGFLPEEREWIDKIINLGYVDVFRLFNKESGNYTFWDPITRARERNEGWRIDYFMVSDDFVKYIKSSKIHPEIMGSDHCPVSLEIEI